MIYVFVCIQGPLAQRFGLNWKSVHPHLAKLFSTEHVFE